MSGQEGGLDVRRALVPVQCNGPPARHVRRLGVVLGGAAGAPRDEEGQGGRCHHRCRTSHDCFMKVPSVTNRTMSTSLGESVEWWPTIFNESLSPISDQR